MNSGFKKIKGRGAQLNPKNRFEKMNIDLFKPDEVDVDPDIPDTKIPTTFFKDHSKTAIAKNDSYDVGFDYSFNPYRGCEHGCVYCYARQTHEYLGFSSGIDFETKIMIKEDGPELLEKEFRKKSYISKLIAFSGNTDCYQPIEKKLEITRRALQVCLKYKNPVSIITKNALIQRDADVIKELSDQYLAVVTMSITTLDKQLANKMEPRTSSPEMRLNTIKYFAERNIPIGVNVAPIIPGLNDKEIPEILKQASLNGATHAGNIMLRLPFAVKDLFLDWVKREFPERANKIINRIKDVRDGKLNSSGWEERFTGKGEIADAIHHLFDLSCKKYNLNREKTELRTDLFIRNFSTQMDMFKDAV